MYAFDKMFCCTAVLLNVDRYINITRPLRYPVILSMRRTYLLVAATWSLALLLGGLVFLAVQLQPGHVCTYSFSVDRFSGLHWSSTN